MLKLLAAIPVMGSVSFMKFLSGDIAGPAGVKPLISTKDGYLPQGEISSGKSSRAETFVSRNFTKSGSFTPGVEGPAVDRKGNIYACNFARQHTIGKVTPSGTPTVFIELPNGSIGNGIRFNSKGDMLIADYVNHNILKVDMDTREFSIYAHELKMNQPNDIAIGANDIIYASDPNWDDSTGRLWRIAPNGKITLLEDNMGTTNGIEVSPGENRLYVNESVQRNVWAYDLSPQGDVSNKRLLIHFSDYGLDGMRCDVEGNLYISRPGAGAVIKVSSSGKILRKIPLAQGKKVSNLAFGGPNGHMVYMTVADVGNIQIFRASKPGRSWKLLHKKLK